MKMRRQHRRASNYTLLEMVAAGGLLAILTTSALDILHQTWLHSRDAMHNTQLCGESLLLRKVWRKHVHACPGPIRLQDGELLSEGDWAANVVGNRLLLRCGKDEKTFPIPNGMDAALTIEAGKSRAVLILGWLSGGPRRHCLRIVACPRGHTRRGSP